MIAIDPGVNSCGVAWFNREGILIQAANRLVGDAVRLTGFDGELVIEMPQTYKGRAARGDANDLIRVAEVVGAISACARYQGATVEQVVPSAWKGQVPKDIMCRRVWSLLREEEKARMHLTGAARRRLELGNQKVPDSATHVLDAAGLGLWKLGRLGKMRSFMALKRGLK